MSPLSRLLLLLAVVVVAAAVLPGGAGAQEPGNMLRNPGCEASSNNVPDSWQAGSFRCTDLSIAGIQARTGRNFFMASSPPNAGENLCTQTVSVPQDPGITQLRFRAYVARRVDDDTAQGALRLEFFDSSRNSLLEVRRPSAANSFFSNAEVPAKNPTTPADYVLITEERHLPPGTTEIDVSLIFFGTNVALGSFTRYYVDDMGLFFLSPSTDAESESTAAAGGDFPWWILIVVGLFLFILAGLVVAFFVRKNRAKKDLTPFSPGEETLDIPADDLRLSSVPHGSVTGSISSNRTSLSSLSLHEFPPAEDDELYNTVDSAASGGDEYNTSATAIESAGGGSGDIYNTAELNEDHEAAGVDNVYGEVYAASNGSHSSSNCSDVVYGELADFE